MKNSSNLDLLRAVAVLMVVISHVGEPLRWSTPEALSFFGVLGVMIFFVHTSLVLMFSLERNGAAVRPFLLRRFFRIYPLAAAMVLLIATSEWLVGEPAPLAQVVSNVLLVQNITGHDSDPFPLWSLPYEVQMYLVLPVIFLFVKVSGLLRIAALIALSLIALVGTAMLALDFHLVRYVPCFLCGVLAYVLASSVRPLYGSSVLFAILGAVILGAAALVLHAGWEPLPIYWGFCLLLGISIPLCRDLTWQPLVQGSALVAKYSYSIYLTHIMAANAAFIICIDLPRVAQWVIFFAVLLGWVRVAYRWIEAPALALGIRLSEANMTPGTAEPKPRGPAPAATANGEFRRKRLTD